MEVMPPSVGKNNHVRHRKTRTFVTLVTQGSGRRNGWFMVQGDGRKNGWEWVVRDLLAEGMGLQRNPNFIGVGITEEIEFYNRVGL